MVERYLPDKLADFAYMEKPIFGGSVDVNFKKSHEDYALRKNQLLEGMKIIQKNGRYMKILESYFGKGTVPEYAFVKELRKSKDWEDR